MVNKIKSMVEIKSKKYKICIVDDEQLILDMYKLQLEKAGFKVVTATDGNKGFTTIKKEKPDLILVDIIMPSKDGFYLIKKLKAQKELAKTPVIVLTNLDSPETREKACELGVLFFLVKPHFMPSQIVNIINEVLRVKRT